MRGHSKRENREVLLVSAGHRGMLTALLHHVNEECLTESFYNLKKTAAVGVDSVTQHENVAPPADAVTPPAPRTGQNARQRRRGSHHPMEPMLEAVNRRIPAVRVEPGLAKSRCQL